MVQVDPRPTKIANYLLIAHNLGPPKIGWIPIKYKTLVLMASISTNIDVALDGF
jgi:hypothetical protein